MKRINYGRELVKIAQAMAKVELERMDRNLEFMRHHFGVGATKTIGATK